MNLITSIIWVAGAMINSKVPYCTITDTEINIVAGLKRFTKTRTWSDVINVERINKNKFKLITKNQKALTVNLFSINSKERSQLVELIQNKLRSVA